MVAIASSGSPAGIDDPLAVRNPPVQERSRRSFERVLTAAGAAFDESGVDRVSMEEVARRAGVSIGAVYRFFPSKSALIATLTDLYRGQHEAFGAKVHDPASLTRPAADVIKDYFSGFASLAQNQPGWQGLTRAGYLFGSGVASQWTVRLERWLAAQVPGLDVRRRRNAAITIQALTGWLLLHAAEDADGLDGALQEAQTVLEGYVGQLVQQTSSHRRPG
ncbi:MAG TPA: TetR/AcrR family transcriptional regulator [Frankiaceae bacterium]|nr:TetR/AcrR family transcriptional regulator [Frankiaceae bacterium]